MRALLDTDVVLDVLLAREPFVDEASNLWLANEQELFEGYVAAITPLNIFYIVRKIKGQAIARQAVLEVLSALRVCTIDHPVLLAAHGLPVTDYEDAVQHASAQSSQVDAIITRNISDYSAATIPIFSPADFIRQLPEVDST